MSSSTALSDAGVITWRNLKRIPRIPELAIFAILQSIMFVLLFTFVFGSSIQVPGESYTSFLMAGIFAQTIVFTSATTAVGMADDMSKGLIDRFRSLPMARSAVLTGRTLADLVRNVFVLALMCVVGVLVGWNAGNTVGGFLGAMGLLLLFGYACTWIFASVGLAVRDAETAQAASFPVMALIVFASSAFVPVSSMPGWLQGFAKYQPLSVVCTASRDLLLGTHTSGHWILGALAWCIGIIVVSAPLAVLRYRRSA